MRPTNPGLRALILACLVLNGCHTAGPGDHSPMTDPGSAAAIELEATVEAYFDEQLKLNPLLATFVGDHRFDHLYPDDLSARHREQAGRIERDYLARVSAIDPSVLSGQDRLSYEIFRRDRRLNLEQERFPDHLVPLNQMANPAAFFAVLGSGSSFQTFESTEDYDNFLGRAEGFVVWVDQAIANMREGMTRGVVQPRVVMEKTLPQLAAHIVTEPRASIFFTPLTRFPAEVSESDRARLTAAYTDLIAGRLVPAYARLHDFVRDEYLPGARDSVGLDALPDGDEWYAHRVRVGTTVDLSAEEIHEIGLQEVARIRGEMKKVQAQVGFEGTLQDFFLHLRTDPRFFFDSEAEILAEYEQLKLRINAALPRLFSVIPRADYEMRPVEAFRARSAAGASYQAAAPDGSRPGIFYVNTYNLKAQPRYGTETLSLHEASPGHHFQISIQQELEGLPRFRRFGARYTAYVEGWALYAEDLGRELGLFRDPYKYYGKLNDEMLRAMRLVVDTGLHARGWTREQVIRYMLDNSSLAETDIVAETERYIAIPGQALGYKIGQLTLRRLRLEASRRLGDAFDLRAFHDELLKDGSLPMSVLEAKMQRWIQASVVSD